MSHELRTPLNAIIGFSEILEDQIFGPLNETQSKYVNNVLKSGRDLLELINQVLDLAKVESGKLEIHLSELKVTDLLEHAIQMIKHKCSVHQIKLDVSIGEDLEKVAIPADELKLKQIMFNLLSNATKFTPDGGAIQVAASRNEDDLVVKVIDTGIGLTAEDQARVFAPFEQVDSSLGRRHMGTGLGLTLAKRLVELHCGRIWVESEGPGKGSTFGFSIPMARTVCRGRCS